MIKNKVVINTSRQINIGCSLFIEDANLTITSSKQILGVSAISRISNYEILNGELRVAGKITYKVIYLSEEDFIMAYDYKKEFLETVIVADIEADDKAMLTSKVFDIEYKGIKDVNIKLTLGLEGLYIKEEAMDFLENVADDILCKKSKVSLEKAYLLSNSVVEISKSFESKEPLSRVLNYNTVCTVDEVFAYDELYQVDGHAITNIMALTEDNKIVNQNFSQTFTVEIPDANIVPYSQFITNCINKSTTIILEEGTTNLIIDLENQIGGISIQQIETEVIYDAYSKEKELILQDKSILVNHELLQIKKEETIKSSFKIDDSVEKIITVLEPFYITTNTINNFGVYAEGVIVAQVIYLNNKEEIRAIKSELPYQILVNEKDIENNRGYTDIFVTDYSAKIMSTNNIELNLNVTVQSQLQKAKNIKIVADIEQGVSKEINDIAISLYIVKENETLWDVAKALSTDEKTLLLLNPDIQERSLKSGDKILLYRELSF